MRLVSLILSSALLFGGCANAVKTATRSTLDEAVDSQGDGGNPPPPTLAESSPAPVAPPPSLSEPVSPPPAPAPSRPPTLSSTQAPLEDETLKLPQVEPKEESVVTTTTPSPAPLPEPPPSLTSPASTGPALIQPGKAVLTAVREQVTLNTKAGKIVIELYPNAAPKTVANFKELISTGFYDGTIFHRVISNFMIQGGDPNTRGDDRSKYGQGGPGYTLPAEISLRHVRGSVAMARTEDNVNPSRESNGSQFYICVVDCPFLDGAYTVFGRVIAGLDAVDQIANSSHDDRDVPRERIEIHATLSAP